MVSSEGGFSLGIPMYFVVYVRPDSYKVFDLLLFYHYILVDITERSVLPYFQCKPISCGRLMKYFSLHRPME